MVSGSISLPSPGFFSPFPHGTRPLSVISWYLALEGGPPCFPQGFSCPVVLRIPLRSPNHSAYGPLTPYGCPFQNIRLCFGVPTSAVLQPRPYNTAQNPSPFCAVLYGRFRLFPFRSPLLRESRLISPPPGTEMFHFPGLASLPYVFR